MVNWLHCIGPGVRQNITAEGYLGRKLFYSWQTRSRGRERDRETEIETEINIQG